MIDIIIPTLNRSERLAELSRNIHENTTVKHRITYVVEPEDTASIDAATACSERVIVSEDPGNHTGAANTGYRQTDYPFLIVANDDFVFKPNWDTEALKVMDTGADVVGLNDDGGGDRCVTIFLIRRKYIEEQSGCMDTPNVVFYPGYYHQYVDNELYETAIKRNVFAKCPSSHIEHMHPGFGKGQKDSTYSKADSHTQQDQKTYQSRRHLWE